MFGIGGQELILLMIIGLIVLGPERLPRVANQIGSWLGQARRMTRVMKRQLEEELDLDDITRIKPPTTSHEPSQQADAEPEYTLPNDDDEYSPAHDDDAPAVGDGDSDNISDEVDEDDGDLAVSEADRSDAEADAELVLEEEALAESKEAS